MGFLEDRIARPFAEALAQQLATSQTPQRVIDPVESPPVFGSDVLGTIVVGLAWDWSAWVNRRVETIEFIEDVTVRRSMSVDFTFPQLGGLAADVPAQTIIAIPLQILAKQPLMHVDVVDEQGASLSTLNTDRNGRLAGRGLVRLFEAFAHDALPNGLPQPVAGQLQELVRQPEDESRKIRAALERDADFRALMKLDTPEPRAEIQLVEDLTKGFLQLVQLPFEPGRNRVIKVRYDVEQPWKEPDEERRLQRALVGIGALPRKRTFAGLSIGQARGHHVEVVAPEDTEIVEAKLAVTQWSKTKNSQIAVKKEAQILAPSRAHVHVRPRFGMSTLKDRLLARGDTAEFTVAIAPRRAGAVVVATGSSAFTALTMLLFASRLSDLDGETSAAVLLLVPAVVTAYLARAGEHPFATRALIGVRMWAMVGAVLAAALSILIGAGLTRPIPATASASTAAMAPAATETRCTIVSRRKGITRRDGFVPSAASCKTKAAAPAVVRPRRWVVISAWALAALSAVVSLVLIGAFCVSVSARKSLQNSETASG